MATKTIQCRDTFIENTDFQSCGNALQAKGGGKISGELSALHTAKKDGKNYLMIFDPVVEYDDAKASEADMEAILNSYNMHKR